MMATPEIKPEVALKGNIDLLTSLNYSNVQLRLVHRREYFLYLIASTLVSTKQTSCKEKSAAGSKSSLGK